jgi:protein disulfide-isomerase A6
MEESTKTMLTIGSFLILILLVVIGFYYMNKKGDPVEKQSHVSVPKQTTTSEQSPAIVLFYADWCGHCQTVKPTWAKLKTMNLPIRIVDMNANNMDPKRYSIQGFPTIRYYPNGFDANSSYIQYEGNRSLESIVKFIQSGGRSF